ncbi:MAG TPA: hypothetical protein VLX92_21510 [Kofleriaceae bacterium]|nr:hypothetical protein [Kofleriaceae bacterium]
MSIRTLALVVLSVAACKHAAPGALIPHTTGPIKIDGEWDEPDWPKLALRGQFVGDDGKLARPSSEVRLLHDDTTLYVGLYAADENVQSSDAFQLELGGHSWTLSVLGTIAPPTPGAQVAVDRDATLDDPRDNDEEWKIELALPLAVTGLRPGEPAPLRASRCDVTKDGVKRCGAWSGAVTL